MKTIRTNEAPKAIGPYAQGKVVNGFLFASGQIALDPKSGELIGTTIQEQTRQVLKNVEAILTAAGTNKENVVKTTCFLKNMADFTAFNEIYGEFFTGDALPARSAVEAHLPKDALVEIEIIASVPEK